MKIKIRNLGHKNIKAYPHIFEVMDGVYHVVIEFDKRVELDAHGSSSIDGQMGLLFSSNDGYVNLEVILPFSENGYIFGDVSKRTYYGTYYSYAAYDRISSTENEFLTGI